MVMISFNRWGSRIILSICNRNLSDRGIAYVSYNTYPGWKRLEQLWDIMLYSEKHAHHDSLKNRTVYTKNVLKLIAETMKMDERARTQSNYKINNINRIVQSNDYYVGHEYLETINDPVYISQFVARAEQQGCTYIGDESLQRSFITWLDGTKFIVPSDEYLKHALRHIEDLGFFRK